MYNRNRVNLVKGSGFRFVFSFNLVGVNLALSFSWEKESAYYNTFLIN